MCVLGCRFARICNVSCSKCVLMRFVHVHAMYAYAYRTCPYTYIYPHAHVCFVLGLPSTEPTNGNLANQAPNQAKSYRDLAPTKLHPLSFIKLRSPVCQTQPNPKELKFIYDSLALWLIVRPGRILPNAAQPKSKTKINLMNKRLTLRIKHLKRKFYLIIIGSE